MPYPSYTHMTDADALAIKAYLFSLAPVARSEQANTLSFPFNQRWAMAFWSCVQCTIAALTRSCTKRRMNRGAYLAKRPAIVANATRRAIWPSPSTPLYFFPVASTLNLDSLLLEHVLELRLLEVGRRSRCR